MTEIDATIEKIVDKVMDTKPHKKSRVPLSAFAEAEPMGSDWDAIKHAHSLGDDRSFFIDAALRDVTCLDAAMIGDLEETGGEDRQRIEGGVSLTRVRVVDPKTLRGTLTTYSPHVLELLHGHIEPSGKYLAERTFLGLGSDRIPIKDARVVVLGENGVRAPTGLELPAKRSRLFPVSREQLAAHAGIFFTRHYEWSVSIGRPGGMSVSIATDPIGAQEVFRLRDIPEGRSRRAALLHWVREHWRKRRTDPSEKTKVMTHLRGATSFVWNGLACKIRPSVHDVRRLRGVA